MNKKTVHRLVLHDGTEVIFDSEAVEKLYNALGWIDVKPRIALYRSAKGLFACIFLGQFKPKRTIELYGELLKFTARNEGVDFKERLIKTLAHELGHFYAFNYASGSTRRWCKVRVWGKRIYDAMLLSALLGLGSYCLIARNASPITSCIFFLAWLIAYLLVVLGASSIIARHDERNANSFRDALMAQHSQLLSECVRIRESAAENKNG